MTSRASLSTSTGGRSRAPTGAELLEEAEGTMEELILATCMHQNVVLTTCLRLQAYLAEKHDRQRRRDVSVALFGSGLEGALSPTPSASKLADLCTQLDRLLPIRYKEAGMRHKPKAPLSRVPWLMLASRSSSAPHIPACDWHVAQPETLVVLDDISPSIGPPNGELEQSLLPLAARCEALAALAREHGSAFRRLGAIFEPLLQHYKQFANLCRTLPTNPPEVLVPFTRNELLLKNHSDHGHVDVADVTGELSGRMTQRMAQYLLQEDELMQREASRTTGTHRTFCFRGVFYKATDWENEGSLRVPTECVAAAMARVLFPEATLIADKRVLLLRRVSMYPRHNLKGSLRRSQALLQAVHDQQQRFNGEGSPEQHTTSPFRRKDFLLQSPELSRDIDKHRRWANRVVHASRCVQGPLLGDALPDLLRTEADLARHHPALCQSFLWQLLTLASDAKGDNFIVHAPDEIICIDYDRVLDPPYIEQHDHRHRLSFRSLIACSTVIMRRPLPDVIRRQVARWRNAAVRLNALERIAACNDCVQTNVRQGVVSPHLAESLQLPCRVPRWYMRFLSLALRRLGHLDFGRPNLCLDDLFQAILPTAQGAYAHMRSTDDRPNVVLRRVYANPERYAASQRPCVLEELGLVLTDVEQDWTAADAGALAPLPLDLVQELLDDVGAARAGASDAWAAVQAATLPGIFPALLASKIRLRGAAYHTLLHHLYNEGHRPTPAVVQVLHDNMLQVDENGRALAHVLYDKIGQDPAGLGEQLDMLVAYGLEIDQLDASGLCAVEHALADGNEEAVRSFLRLGSNGGSRAMLWLKRLLPNIQTAVDEDIAPDAVWMDLLLATRYRNTSLFLEVATLLCLLSAGPAPSQSAVLESHDQVDLSDFTFPVAEPRLNLQLECEPYNEERHLPSLVWEAIEQQSQSCTRRCFFLADQRTQRWLLLTARFVDHEAMTDPTLRLDQLAEALKQLERRLKGLQFLVSGPLAAVAPPSHLPVCLPESFLSQTEMPITSTVPRGPLTALLSAMVESRVGREALDQLTASQLTALLRCVDKPLTSRAQAALWGRCQALATEMVDVELRCFEALPAKEVQAFVRDAAALTSLNFTLCNVRGSRGTLALDFAKCASLRQLTLSQASWVTTLRLSHLPSYAMVELAYLDRLSSVQFLPASDTVQVSTRACPRLKLS
ncbi:uncharacterized protein MONBRDRAFT_9151 [Monosiga brevicollis MX1]|uniref:Uncharacterized protein n=1 Tax=Monosiga brevicollis TaxID=81824 RepID=A9V287_MONBE|nr:uncharacterized protein MONBRDRAFT_9151 [Monosiga brevicollis MX1]EDQ88214.1 predicted protein [Monosiga brevicollis MX1]|eukprot:XP_001746807.1 hypothetical protein [Monosiga brevicollis MX1]